MILDEIAPKATGRDAQIDKKRAVSAKLQGAAADREGGRDGMEVSGHAVQVPGCPGSAGQSMKISLVLMLFPMVCMRSLVKMSQWEEAMILKGIQ